MSSGGAVITARECQLLQKATTGVEREVCDILITRYDAAIRQAVKQNVQSILVTVPTFLYGYPEFDRTSVKRSVMNVFSNNGFKIEEVNDVAFRLDWSPEAPPATVTEAVTGAAVAVAAAAAAAAHRHLPPSIDVDLANATPSYQQPQPPAQPAHTKIVKLT